jgi:hypothetical protein
MSLNMNLNVLSAVEADNIHTNRSLSSRIFMFYLQGRLSILFWFFEAMVVHSCVKMIFIL